MRKFVLFLPLLAVTPVAGFAQTSPSSISVENAWSRATAPSMKTGVVYLTIVDHGVPDRLLAAATPAADKAELHQTIRNGNVTEMRPADGGVPVAPDKPATFAPGGYHIMLVGLKQPLHQGQSFPLTLTFEKAGTVQTTVLVRSVGAGGAMQMGGPGQGMTMPVPSSSQSKP